MSTLIEWLYVIFNHSFFLTQVLSPPIETNHLGRSNYVITKQILTKFIEPDWYKEDFKLPTKEHLESDPLDYLEKLEEAKALLGAAYHKALDKEFKAYQKGLSELKKDLDKLREENQINIHGSDEQKKIEEFMDQTPGAAPKSENFRTWMDTYIRTPCKLLYQELIRAELNISASLL